MNQPNQQMTPQQIRLVLANDALRYIDDVAAKLLIGMMNSPMRPDSDEGRGKAAADSYSMALAMFYHRMHFRRLYLEMHSLPPEPSLY